MRYDFLDTLVVVEQIKFVSQGITAQESDINDENTKRFQTLAVSDAVGSLSSSSLEGQGDTAE